MYKLILVDDHLIFRESLSLLLNQEGIADVIAEAGDGKEFLELLDKHRPDVVLMDISMPIMDGIEAAQKAIAQYPDLKILTLSSFGDEKYYHKMVSAGVRGFILKSTGIAELQQAIEEVANGGSWFSNELLRKIITHIGNNEAIAKKNQLSPREVEVLAMICKGYSNEQIAEKLHLSYETVRSHKSKLQQKTETSNMASLVMYAIKHKIVEV